MLNVCLIKWYVRTRSLDNSVPWALDVGVDPVYIKEPFLKPYLNQVHNVRRQAHHFQTLNQQTDIDNVKSCWQVQACQQDRIVIILNRTDKDFKTSKLNPYLL